MNLHTPALDELLRRYDMGTQVGRDIIADDGKSFRCFKCGKLFYDWDIAECETCGETFCDGCLVTDDKMSPEYCVECDRENQAIQDTYRTMPKGRD